MYDTNLLSQEVMVESGTIAGQVSFDEPHNHAGCVVFSGEGAMEANSGEQKSPRPSSLIVEADASKPHHHHHHHHHHRDAKAVYMEIPHQSTTPERDKPPSGRDKSTPARSLTSSLSKDSLVLSPDSVREKSVDKDSESGKPETSSNPCPVLHCGVWR